ncbi:MAG: site-specific DNA-methyltransferase, partial [Opitutales bacterium]
LTEDGVVFISIDGNELASLSRVCDEVFGEDNALGTLVWKNATDNNPTNIAVEHEYIVSYCRSKSDVKPVWKSNFSDIKDLLKKVGDELNRAHRESALLESAYAEWFRENKSQLGKLDRYKYIDKGGIYTGSQSVHNPGREGYRYDVIHPVTGKPCKEPLMGYRFPQESMQKLIDAGRILYGEDENKIVEIKVYAEEYSDKLSSVYELDGRLGAYDLRDLFPELRKTFTNPKPLRLLSHLASFVLEKNDIILDFFAGSSTTAHAVMQLNAEDGGNRRFIMVQLPEACDEKSEAFKAGYPTIAEISKERIRRAGKKIKEENATNAATLDTGFRVLKVDTSNVKDIYYTPDQIKQDELTLHIDHIKEGRSAEDLLFQVMLDWGVDLSLPVTPETILGKQVYFVDDNANAACFETGVDEDFVKELAKRKPLRAVFRDSGYANDAVKINIGQIFQLLSPTTDLKTL